VTEPLDPGWKKSRINVPSPGTIASYRKGRFHVHEMRGEWRVHLDRYDPEVHPLLHLVDDAPLLLMISDTFMTLVMDTKRTDIKKTADILKTQRFIWQEQLIFGLILCLVGFFIINNPLNFFKNLFELIIPCVIIGLAIVILVRPFRTRLPENYQAVDLSRGAGILCAGIFAFILPLALWIIFILVILAAWMIASAGMLLSRVAKGRHAVPEGFYSRMAIGIISLILAIQLFFSPTVILIFLIEILGAVTVLLGITLCINGLRLRTWMKQTTAP
jgi:protein-S-isoprenylcysteine O-methyltransferase Ste14